MTSNHCAGPWGGGPNSDTGLWYQRQCQPFFRRKSRDLELQQSPHHPLANSPDKEVVVPALGGGPRRIKHRELGVHLIKIGGTALVHHRRPERGNHLPRLQLAPVDALEELVALDLR